MSLRICICADSPELSLHADAMHTKTTLVNVYVDLLVLPELHRPEVVDIGVNTMYKK